MFKQVGIIGFMLIVAGCFLGGQDSEWITLFDGETFDGWKANENPGSWTIEEGAFKGQGPRSHLFYVEREFEDFEFETEVKTLPGSNSGIFFHTRFQDSGWPEYGLESQVNNTQGDPVRTGSIYGVVKLYETPARDNEWWTQNITVKGDNVVVRINGRVVLDYTQPPGVEGPKRLDKGLFAFQQHDPGSVVFYRNIRVRPL